MYIKVWYITFILFSGSPEKIQKVQDADCAGDGPKKNMVEMEHIENEGQDQDMCSVKEDDGHEVMTSKLFSC